jgi:hypothetical protein
LPDEEPSVLKRIVHPSTDHVRPAGLAAIVGGVLGICVAPLYSLAYFATDEVAPSEEPGWADSGRDLAEPLLTFASADAVYLTYGKLFLFVWAGMLAGLIALHATQGWQGDRLERWGYRASLLATVLLVIGAFGAYWLELTEVFFAGFLLPGILLLAVGSPVFGVGTWRAGVAPRAGALLLVVGGPATLVISDFATLGGGLVLLYLAWVVLGYALWSGAARQPHQITPPTASS